MDEVLTGVEREISVETVSACERCHGNGAEPGTPIHTCDTCEGAGQVREVARTPFGQVMRASACPTCGGAGKTPETPCEACEGSGREVRPRAWEVQVPPGIDSGQRIRIAGAGHVGDSGAPSGDLYVEVVVAEDERFERHGQDLVSVVDVPVTRAMLGGSVTVPTLDGEREVDVPAGAQPGERMVLGGLGLPSLRSAARGDQHVLLEVRVPGELSDEERDLVERLDRSIDGR
jgi:molecular chaperone DnaJ